jgi:site-specific DNA recombinase
MTTSKQSSSEKKKAAIYCRVSTYDQSTGEYSSLSGQEDLLKRYCETQGWEIFDIYKDSVSGSDLEREQLQRLMLDAEDKKFQVLLATKLDRISRSVYDFLNLDNKLRELGIDIVIATQNIDTTTPTGKMQRTILLAFAEFERDMIAERTREKLFLQAQKGYWGGGHTPLGYDVVDKKLIVNQEESELVKRIFNYYLETPSTNKVAIRLNKEGFRSKQRNYLSGKISGGGKFSKETIKRLLNNVIYLGKIKIQDQEFNGIHEPIIEADLFEKVKKNYQSLLPINMQPTNQKQN